MQRWKAALPALALLALLALSATTVLGAGPKSQGPSHSQASASHPVDASEPSEAPDNDNPGAGASHPVNHGCVVSAAARAARASGGNHGKAVSAVAKVNHGHAKDRQITTCESPAAP